MTKEKSNQEYWNEILFYLRRIETIWETKLRQLSRREVQSFPGKAGKILGVCRLASYHTFLRKILDYIIVIGGLSELKPENIVIEKEEKE